MDREQRGISFYNWWGKGYDYSVAAPWLRYIQRKVALQFTTKKGDRILDAGVGTGYFLSLFKDKECELYGIDIAQGMLDVAKKRLGASAKLTCASISDVPFEDNFFDFIISTEAFHHYKDPTRAMQEMYRTLKPGGTLIVADLYLQPLFLWKALFLLEPGYITFYSKKEFQNLFETNKFTVLEQKRIGGPAIFTKGKK